MLAAYNNSAFEAISHNLLHVLNRGIGTNFHYDAYKYVTKWQGVGENEGRVEKYLSATSPQHVLIPPLNEEQQPVEAEIAEEEPLFLGLSTKFTRVGVEAMLEQAGMALCGWFTDSPGRYALALVKRK
jgi:L-histidine Nalpha-methyltransferase